MAAQRYPRRLPILRKEVDQPAGPTLLHDFGTAVPRSPAPPSGSPALSSPCGPCFFATFQLLAVVRIPTTAEGSRKGHVLLHPKRPFPSCLQTLHTCSADCHQAEDRGRVSKKPCEPKYVSTLTGSNKFTLIPLQTFQRLRWSSHWTFQVFFRHAQAGSGGFFPECFFDELGDKICLLHLLPLSWPTKDSPFDSMCRLFFFRPHCLVQFIMVVVHCFPLPRFPGKWPGRRHANPHRPAGPLSIVPTVGRIDERAPYTFFMRPQCNLVRFFSDDF